MVVVIVMMPRRGGIAFIYRQFVGVAVLVVNESLTVTLIPLRIFLSCHVTSRLC